MQSQRLVQKQVQKLKMTPQLYQAVRLMALPLQDLRTTIEEELEKNPALLAEEDRSTVSLDSLPAREGTDAEGEWFDHSSDTGYSRGDGDAASDARRQFLEGALSQPESLQDHLLAQLALQPVPEPWMRLGELVIRNLDDNGFYKEPLEVLLAEEPDRDLLPNVLPILQGLDPIGTCVQDVRESLLVQIRAHPSPHPRAAEVVGSWFEALEKQHLREIEKGMHIPESLLREIVAFIRTLEPLPGRNFTRDMTRYVLPDVQVELRDGEFVIVLNDEMIPVLGLNPLYEQMAKARGETKDPQTRRFAAQKLQDARWFMRTVGQRNETLLKVCRAIVEFQREFFLKGPKSMRPLTLKDVAVDIGVHEATVSRITSSKHMQTEWGIFSLKHFFSNSVAGTSEAGARFSKEGVKEIIREIIGKEIAREHLSDQKIVELLAARGVSLARRTVAKYRGELDIESSYQRRRS